LGASSAPPAQVAIRGDTIALFPQALAAAFADGAANADSTDWGQLLSRAAILALAEQSLLAAHWTTEQYSKLVGDGIVLVAEETGKLRGVVCAKVVTGEWEIENVVVAGECLRRGIASQLLYELMQRAESAAASAILLEVRESNLPARRLYEKLGFCEEGRRRRYYREPPGDAILYALRFTR